MLYFCWKLFYQSLFMLFNRQNVLLLFAIDIGTILCKASFTSYTFSGVNYTCQLGSRDVCGGNPNIPIKKIAHMFRWAWWACAIAVMRVWCLSFDLSDRRVAVYKPTFPSCHTTIWTHRTLSLYAGLVAGLLARRTSPIFNGQTTLFFARTMATGAKIQGQYII